MSSSLIEFVKIDSCDDPIDHEDKLKVCNHLACELYKKRNNQIIILSSLVLLLVVASCLAVCEYSGHNKPIMYGDFEAQRHWMELTINLPISKCWVELDKSRGLEQIEHKLFMRFSVIITFMLIYAPALILLIIQNEGRQNKISFLQLAQVLLFPGLLFIDCAHFQYNHLSLGLFLWAILAFDKGKLCLGSALFVLALNHKQMEDKVANFWCCASIFIKFKQIYSTENLIKMSTLLVLSTCLPSLYCLLLKPNGRNFRIALVICSLSFFLFSFQVHEKSILLVGIPALLLLDDKTLGNSIGILLSTCCFRLFF
uniref:Alpha-1,3-glucosyltransferase n=1 Tax=Meloidogyne hapla TaxID=6305 RepID=A0A1I8B8N4_MELHA